MARASMKVDIKKLRQLSDRMNSSTLREQLNEIPKQRGVMALIAQAIRDNFDEQGPGWKPLKAATIRGSISKKQRKLASQYGDKELGEHEARHAKASGGGRKESKQFRRILQRTGLLMKSVTTPGAPGNIYQVVGSKIIWGTDLAYAKIHNEGGKIQVKAGHRGGGASRYKKVGKKKVRYKSKGMGQSVRAHSINIPKREFLVIRPVWLQRIRLYVLTQMSKVVVRHLVVGGKKS